MHLRYYLFLLFSTVLTTGFSQSIVLSEDARISVLTCGPGEELYTRFGHSAFRVQDSGLGIDVVYNYGTFNFNAPNFYSNFARGKLIYTLSRQRFENFLYDYELENRWVKEQLLGLNRKETMELFEFLENNYKPENRDYQYDFLYDNCSTKMPDVLKKLLGPQLEFLDDHLEKHYTFRQLIRQNLRTNSWASFGIDLALGADIDRKATARQHMFLPKYVMMQLANSRLNGRPLIRRTRTVLDNPEQLRVPIFTTSPLFWFALLSLFTITITYIDYRNKARSRWLDFFLFFSSGLVGFFLLFLWFLTDHNATVNNLNVLWAFPFNLIVAFLLVRRKNIPDWLEKYLKGLFLLFLVMVILWLFKVQVFSPLVILLILPLLLRYFWILYYVRNFE